VWASTWEAVRYAQHCDLLHQLRKGQLRYWEHRIYRLSQVRWVLQFWILLTIVFGLVRLDVPGAFLWDSDDRRRIAEGDTDSSLLRRSVFVPAFFLWVLALAFVATLFYIERAPHQDTQFELLVHHPLDDPSTKKARLALWLLTRFDAFLFRLALLWAGAIIPLAIAESSFPTLALAVLPLAIFCALVMMVVLCALAYLRWGYRNEEERDRSPLRVLDGRGDNRISVVQTTLRLYLLQNFLWYLHILFLLLRASEWSSFCFSGSWMVVLAPLIIFLSIVSILFLFQMENFARLHWVTRLSLCFAAIVVMAGPVVLLGARLEQWSWITVPFSFYSVLAIPVDITFLLMAIFNLRDHRRTLLPN
jgi:hypothetical protein